MLYLSEVTGKSYPTVEELEAAELEAQKKNEEIEAKKAERKARADEVEKAFAEAREAQNKANELLTQFCKDYGAYHKTYRSNEKIPNVLDAFFEPFWRFPF